MLLRQLGIARGVVQDASRSGDQGHCCCLHTFGSLVLKCALLTPLAPLGASCRAVRMRDVPQPSLRVTRLQHRAARFLGPSPTGCRRQVQRRCSRCSRRPLHRPSSNQQQSSQQMQPRSQPRQRQTRPPSLRLRRPLPHTSSRPRLSSNARARVGSARTSGGQRRCMPARQPAASAKRRSSRLRRRRRLPRRPSPRRLQRRR